MIHPEYCLSSSEGRGDAVSLQWGMVNIPIRLFIVSDDTRSVPARSMFTSDGHAIGNRKYDKETGANYEGEVVKKALVGDKWVELTDDEIASHSTIVKGIAEISTFVPLSAIGTVYAVQEVRAWLPDSMKVGKTKMPNPAAVKAAALLRTAMATRGVAALTLVPTRGGGQYHALLPDGSAAVLSYAEAVRALTDTAEAAELSAQELELADRLIDSIGVAQPLLSDEAGARIRVYLEGKAGGVVETVAAPVEAAAPIDLMAALGASIDAVKAAKPAPVKAAPAVKAPAKRAAKKAS